MQTRISLINISREYNEIRHDIEQKVLDALHSCQYILGPEVSLFEAQFAELTNSQFARGVASGSDALELALRALGVGAGDEVITTPLTYIATSQAIELVGAKIVFADVNPLTLTLDPVQVEKKITKKTKAILPVHIFGLPCDMLELSSIARAHQLPIIEDAAQAVGSTWNDKPLGTYSDIVCYSFFPTKNLGACGDAGIITTNDERLARSLDSLRCHGTGSTKYIHVKLGRNSRLDTIQAAILSVKLPHLPRYNERRRKNALVYEQRLGSLRAVCTPKMPSLAHHVFHAYCIRALRRNQLQQYLKSQGIETAVYYPLPLHLQPVYQDLGYRKQDLPHSEKFCEECLALPIHSFLTEEELDYICTKIVNFYNET